MARGPDTIDEYISDIRLRLRRQWLRVGLVPVLAVVLLALGTSAVHASNLEPHMRAAELRLQIAMAVAAAAFLVGFWLEGYRTDTGRVLRSVAKKRAVRLGELSSDDVMAARADVEKWVLEAHLEALGLGWAVASATLVAAFFGMPVKHCAIVATMAVLYELYVLSRHRHALELLWGIATGELAAEAHLLAAYDDFRPTPAQRIAMLFGWRPNPTRSQSGRGRGQKVARKGKQR